MRHLLFTCYLTKYLEKSYQSQAMAGYGVALQGHHHSAALKIFGTWPGGIALLLAVGMLQSIVARYDNNVSSGMMEPSISDCYIVVNDAQ
jgi:hypothetical protein